MVNDPARRSRRVQAVAMVLVAALALAVPPAARAARLPSFAEVRAAWRPSDVTLLDRHGLPLQTVRVDKTVRRLDWVRLEEMSPALRHAIVLSEDKRFHEHSGVDWGAVAQSAWANLWNERTRGASTITMQLAGLLDEGLGRPAGGRSAAQKLGQAVAAAQLEARWRKSDILEAYLNLVAFRGEVVGIGALSQTLFGKVPSGLDAQESAIAAALVRAPNAPAARVAERACGVLQQQKLPCAGVVALAETALARRAGMPLGPQLAPHFARQALAARRGAPPARLATTLDAPLQRAATELLRRQIAELQRQQVDDGALVVLDNASGEVLAWVGSSGALSEAPEVDGVLARRQPGSTLKPFVYGLAIERGFTTAASVLDDSPAQISTANGLYLPQNYDRDFKGPVSARTALGASLNVPAVRLGAMLGSDALFERLNALGFALPENGGYYGVSLALGSPDVTLLALANAYRALANGGRVSPPRLLPATPGSESRRVIDPRAAYVVTDILADNNARVRTFGLDSVLATRGFAAVKTGTSKDLRDNWCVGFTDRYTVAVWVGNARGAPMQAVSGIAGAAPVWQGLVRTLHAGRPSKPPAMPGGVVRRPVRFVGLDEPPREEVFIAGTEPAGGIVRLAATPAHGIVSPRDGSIFSLDPDIPPRSQQIVFEGEAGVWRLDGRRLGEGRRLQWTPWPGRHRLALLSRDGRVLQEVGFEVRGAAVAARR